MPADSIVAAIRRLLEAGTTMVLATAGQPPGAWATPLYYWPDENLRLYWLSSPDSRHSRNLSASPRAAVAVYANASRWQEIRGVQLEGVASQVAEPAERERVLDSYRRRFALGPEMDALIAHSALYVFEPSWARYLDNALGLGFKIEAAL